MLNPTWPSETASLDAASNASEVRASRQHDRRAHLAYLVEAAPEHAARDTWLRELSGDGPAYQRAWAIAQRSKTAQQNDSR